MSKMNKKQLAEFMKMSNKILTTEESNTTVKGFALCALEQKDTRVKLGGMITNLSQRDVLRLVCSMMSVTPIDGALSLCSGEKDLMELVEALKSTVKAKKKVAKKKAK